MTLPVQNHPAVMEGVCVDKVAVSREAGIVPIFDMIASDLIAPLVRALLLSARFVITAVGQKLMANIAILRDPHSDIVMLLRHPASQVIQSCGLADGV